MLAGVLQQSCPALSLEIFGVTRHAGHTGLTFAQSWPCFNGTVGVVIQDRNLCARTGWS